MKKLLYTLAISLTCLSCQNNSEHEHNHPHDEHGHDHDNHEHVAKDTKSEQITFLTKQAKTIEFSVKKVKQEDVYQVIRCSGIIESMQGDEQIITAKSGGIILFNTDKTLIGKAIVSGQDLCTISSSGITDNNMTSKFIVAKAKFEQASSAHERGKKLAVANLITADEFEELIANVEISKTAYLTLQSNFSDGGKLVKSPFTGFIKNLLVKEGQHVQSGDPLMVVSKNKNLIIKAEVSQKYFSDLPFIISANFKTAYDSKVHSIEEFNGKLISYGKNVNAASNYLPVYFEINNKGELLPGAFIEVYLKTKPIKNILAVPLSAVMEDYENHFVFIRTSHETYEKRNVKLGINDGEKVQILMGVSEGEWVVWKGAYQIKMSSVSSSIPSHGHSH